jgi:hypothetical protein
MEFATDVVGDDVVQRTSGEALRNTVTYAVRPGVSVGMFSFCCQITLSRPIMRISIPFPNSFYLHIFCQNNN